MVNKNETTKRDSEFRGEVDEAPVIWPNLVNHSVKSAPTLIFGRKKFSQIINGDKDDDIPATRNSAKVGNWKKKNSVKSSMAAKTMTYQPPEIQPK